MLRFGVFWEILSKRRQFVGDRRAIEFTRASVRKEETEEIHVSVRFPSNFDFLITRFIGYDIGEYGIIEIEG